MAYTLYPIRYTLYSIPYTLLYHLAPTVDHFCHIPINDPTGDQGVVSAEQNHMGAKVFDEQAREACSLGGATQEGARQIGSVEVDRCRPDEHSRSSCNRCWALVLLMDRNLTSATRRRVQVIACACACV